jgi:hypothetical protein
VDPNTKRIHKSWADPNPHLKKVQNQIRISMQIQKLFLNKICCEKYMKEKKVVFLKTFFCRPGSRTQKKVKRGCILKNIRPKY